MGRLVANRSLAAILPKGSEGGKEFARIVDLLLFRNAEKEQRTITLLNDSAGDFAGLDSYSSLPRRAGTIGFQYKFFASPLSDEHRAEIKESLESAITHFKKS